MARSSAYTVATILIQLQSFLFEENAIPQDYGGSRKNFPASERVAMARKIAETFKCPGCSHGSMLRGTKWRPGHRCVWPALPPLKSHCTEAAKPDGDGTPEEKIESPTHAATIACGSQSKSGAAVAVAHLVGLTSLEDFLWLEVCSYITVQDAYRLLKVCRHAARVHHRYNIVRRREMICFHRCLFIHLSGLCSLCFVMILLTRVVEMIARFY